MSIFQSSRRVRAFVLIAAIALSAFQLSSPQQSASAAAMGSSQFKGVNWADPNDNFSNSYVVPSGLSTADSYATTYSKSTQIIEGFQSELGANTVRLPINPYSVGTSWWTSYQGAIDAATAQGFNVILAYWEGTGANYDGKIDNLTSFWSMWQTVTSQYGSNSHVFFEPMNEPYGYSLTDWSNIAAQWLSNYPSVPANRVIVSGTGFDNDVTGVCADPRLAGTYLALHDYAFSQGNMTYAQWLSQFRGSIGSCASRTILDEFGAPMTTGLNYDGSSTASDSTSNDFIAYIQAMTDSVRSLGIGSVYWPGLRTGDTYSMTQLGGTATNPTLSVTNSSGLDRVRWGWGTGSDVPLEITSASSSRCLDVPGAVQTNGTHLEIYDCNGGANQEWTLTAAGELRIYGYKCLDASGQGLTASTPVILYDCNGGSNQQWSMNSSGAIVGTQSGLCLDVTNAATSNGSKLELWGCNGGSNQSWSRQ